MAYILHTYKHVYLIACVERAPALLASAPGQLHTQQRRGGGAARLRATLELSGKYNLHIYISMLKTCFIC